jgi:transcriptional regulator with XRE-family HTH domain
MPKHPDAPAYTFGQRIRRARERNGQTRAVLGGLVGRSAEWVKALETGRLQMPRLPLLLRLAEVLSIADLAELTGDERLSASTYTKAAHTSLPAVVDALTVYRFNGVDEEPESAAALAERIRQAWELWHSPGEHRTRIAALLPHLIADVQFAARRLEGMQRRRVLALLAQTYHLAQLYLAFQPESGLVTLTGDRAMTAAQHADDPHSIAAAAWYLNHAFRSGGTRHEARVNLAMKAANLLSPDRSPEDLACWGLMHLACALSFAKVGRRGDAEHYWDKASDAARRLGDGYAHPTLMFGRGLVDAYAVTMNTDLMSGGAAVEAASRIDLGKIPSATRRSFHLLETARAYSLEREPVAVVHLLKKAHEVSPETARFNLFARSTLMELQGRRSNTLIRDDVAYLAQQLGAVAV